MARDYVTAAFRPGMVSQFAAWSWRREDFADDYATLQAGGLLAEDGGAEKIWQTSQKYVLKVRCPSGRVVAYKAYRHMDDCLRYVYRPSPLAREAMNYQRLQDLGLPMARLLAVGEDRRCFVIRGGFLATEFADCDGDGRDFCPGGRLSANTALRDEFIQTVFGQLAQLHNAGWAHQGSTPANFLYRLRDGHPEIIWIDVATCRRKSRWSLKRLVPGDFVNFFRFFDFTPEEHRAFEAHYLAAAHGLFTADALFHAVEAALQANPKYRRRIGKPLNRPL